MDDDYTRRRDGFLIATDPARLDCELVFRFLSEEAYWSKGMTRDVFERSLAGSLCFGLYDATTGKQLGFGRVITDFATVGRLVDVFVVPAARRQGLGKWLVETIFDHPRLKGLRGWSLSTNDQQKLYRSFGFSPADPATNMVRKGDAP